MTHDVDGTAEEVAAEPITIQGEVAHTTELVPHYSAGKTELITAATPAERVAVAREVATELNNVIVGIGARTKVGNMKVTKPDGSESWEPKYHVNVEGWQTLATLLGVALVERYVRPVIDPATGLVITRTFTVTEKRGRDEKLVTSTYEVTGHDWEACVDAVKDGVIIATGSGMVSRSELTWAKRDEFALRGMAATRATSRAMRQAAAWVVALAGYSTTPMEEMPAEADAPPPAPPFAAEATIEQRKAAFRALVYMLDGSEADATAALANIAGRWGGVLMRGACDTLAVAAATLKAGRMAEPEQAAEPTPEPEHITPEPEPGDVPHDLPNEPDDGPPVGEQTDSIPF